MHEFSREGGVAPKGIDGREIGKDFRSCNRSAKRGLSSDPSSIQVVRRGSSRRPGCYSIDCHCACVCSRSLMLVTINAVPLPALAQLVQFIPSLVNSSRQIGRESIRSVNAEECELVQCLVVVAALAVGVGPNLRSFRKYECRYSTWR